MCSLLITSHALQVLTVERQDWSTLVSWRTRISIECLLIASRTLDTVHTIFVSHAIYTYTVSNFGNPLVVIEVIWYVFRLCPDAELEEADLAVLGAFW